MDVDVLHRRAWTRSEGARAQAQVEAFPTEIAQALLTEFEAESGEVQRWHLEPGPRGPLSDRARDSWTDAHDHLRSYARTLAAIPNLQASLSDDDIEARAELAAEHCRARLTLEEKIEYVERHGLEVPDGPRVTRSSLCRRFNSAEWWVPKFRRRWSRETENAFRQANFVNRRQSPYVSKLCAERYREQRRKAEAAIAQLDLLNEETGEVCPLAHIVEGSMANPTHRNAELMTHARGLQEYAQSEGHTCLMVTATTPSRYHSSLAASSAKNPNYDGSSPRDAQEWLCRCWARARAAFKKRKLEVYGWRVAEPHHDGTPHWHLIIYCAPAVRDWIEKVLRKKWLRDSPNEPGAQAYRLHSTAEDPAKGSAVGYLAKYVAKNLEGGGTMRAVESDSADMTVGEASELAVTWSRVWGIRQFQSFGQPVKALWRHLRRLEEVPTAPALAALARVAAHTEDGGAPNYRNFIYLLGGHRAAYKLSRLFLDRDAPRCVDPCGRRVLKVTRWGELPADRPMGLLCRVGPRLVRIRTCRDSFRLIFRSASGLGPVTLTVAFGKPGEEGGEGAEVKARRKLRAPRPQSQAPPARAVA